MHWYIDVLKKYIDFGGRAGREEYWMFHLIHFGVTFLLTLVSVVFSGGNTESTPWLGAIYAFATFLPSMGLSVRRLHDIGKSGWWLLVGLIPFGTLVILYFSILEGSVGSNAYGPSPLDTSVQSAQKVESAYVAESRPNPAYK